MISKLRQSNLSGDDLESIVTDMAVQAARNANSQGMKEQIELLNQLGYDDDYIWMMVLRDQLTDSSEVVVSDPLRDDSPHSKGFGGVVVDLNDDTVTVVDVEGHHYDVGFDEIEIVSY